MPHRKRRRGSASWRRKTHSPDATSSPESRSGLSASTEMYCGDSGLSTENRARVDFSARTRSGRGWEAGCFRSVGGPADSKKTGAGDGTRTRDIQLGRLELYQLSYSRSNLLCGHSMGWSGAPRAPWDGWWRGEDSNLRRHRRQIYSLFPLATRVPLHIAGGTAELAKGLEPLTTSLQMRCSTN